MKANRAVQILAGILILAVLAVGVVFGLYEAGVISLGGATIDEDGKKNYSISYDLTGVTADSSNATTIKEDGAVTLEFTKKYSNYTLQDLAVDGATLSYYLEDGFDLTVVVSSPTSAVTVMVVVAAPWSSGSTDSEQSDTTSDNDEEEESYTISWVEGYVASGYSFDYDCPTEAQAGDTVTIMILNTAGGNGNLYLQISSDDGTVITSGALSFGYNTYSFTMPEGNVTITYTVTTTSGGAT